jgi:Zn ribbon nucleic-acid-binding protein
MIVSLLNRVAPRELLSVLNIDSAKLLPAVSTCPICRARDTLEITPGANGVPIYTCLHPRCGFIGDGPELFATARKIDVEAACFELVSAGIIPAAPDLHVHVETYLEYLRNEVTGAMGWWKTVNQRVKAGSTHAAGILQSRGCWGVSGLDAYLGVARGAEIQDLVEERLFMLQPWRHYLVIPLWSDPRTLTGFSCLADDGDAIYVHLDRRVKSVGFGFLHSVSARSERVIVTNHPMTTLETLSNALAGGLRVATVYAHDRTNAWPSIFAKRRVFMNTAGSLETYKQALSDPSSLVVSPLDLRKPQPQELMTPGARLAHLEASASIAHVSLGNFLSSLSYPEAKAAVARLELSNQDISRVMSGISEVSRGRLEALFREVQENQVIQYNGDRVAITEQGWVSQKKNVIISNTVFLIDRMICDAWNNQQLAAGVVIQNRKQYQFTVPVADLQKRPEIWLQQFMNSQRGDFVAIAPGWGNKLYHLSLQFRTPVTEHTVVTTGWANDNQRLVLPQITLEAGNIEKVQTPLKGAGAGLIGMGDVGTWEIDEALKDTEEAAVFWALFAAITVNVFAPHHAHGTSGIALVEAKGTVLETVANDAVDAIGIERVVFASTSPAAMKEIKNKELKGVLPIYVDELWSRSRGFSQWQKLDEHRNALVSMSKAVAIATSLGGEWVYITAKGGPGNAKALQMYWNLLPEFWAHLQTHGFPELTRSSMVRGLLAGPITAWLRSLGYESPKSVKMAMDLVTVDLVAAQAPWGYRFIGLLIECVRAGLLKSYKNIETDDHTMGVIINDTDGTAFIAKSTVNELPFKEISDRLQESSCLLGQRSGGTAGYVIPLDRWNLCWSVKL